MLRHILAFELRYQLRQPLFWGTAGVFAMMGFVATVTDALQIGGAIGSVNRNAPYVIVRMLANLSLIGSFMVVAFVATSILRDFERRTDELVFSRPVNPGELLLGRFVGSLAAACVCFSAATVGLMVGALMPWLDPERIGPFSPWAYVYGLGLLAFPTFTILGALFFTVAARVRHLGGTYAALVGLLVAYFAATAMFGDLESRRTAAILDPFGFTAFESDTRYWTIAEKNGRIPPATGVILWNRALWMSIALVCVAWAVSTFRYERAARSRARAIPTRHETWLAPVGAPVRRAAPFQASTSWVQLRSELGLEIRALLRSVPFVVILAFGLINVLANMGYLDLMLGTPVWPVTHLMLLAISSGYSFLLVLILTFYAGESVWRARAYRMDGIVDATPVPSWVPLTAKVVALWVAASVFIGAGVIALVGFQLAHGYFRLEPDLYAQGVVVEIVPYLLMAVLAVFLQVLVNQKFVGYLLMVLFLISGAVLTALHFDHRLYRFGSAPSAPYSDMNGWGHFAGAVYWFDAYWTCAAGVLFVLALLAWVRGSDVGARLRWRTAKRRFGTPMRLVLILLAVATGVLGAFIYYNTNVLNEYVASDEAERRLADYEKRYRRYRDVPQPRVASIRSAVDIFPAERRALIAATYRLVNRSDRPIGNLHLSWSPRVHVRRLELPRHRLAHDDRQLGYAIYELDAPLQPGAEMPLRFVLEMANPGFVNNNADNSIVENGTFVHSRQFPSIGYQEYRELGDPAARRRHGLPTVVRMPKIDDLRARQRNDLAPDADWMDFDTIVSTSLDQTALAPGDLQREWTDGRRRFFHYRAATPIPKFFSYLSARYAVRRDAWGDTRIEVFYHPAHTYNVERMVDAVKKTLTYMTANFSPYQHRHIRIAEIPRYIRAAASFPNTIPFSESIGFIARLKDRSAIDYPFYVTAHEVAHQWWGYQVLGAGVQGANMLSESMAQYAALMVMKHEYGAASMRRFLKFELDGYLSGRGGELIEELPLELVEHQSYIHYRKGSLVLYALQDAIGETALNGALRRYIASVRQQGPPYTVSRDLLAFVTEVTPPDRRHLIEDLFASITLFDLRTIEATSRKRPDGRHEVTIRGEARKLRADGSGHESEVPVDDWIDVGVFAAPDDRDTQGRVLYLRKHRVTGRTIEVRAVVSGVPSRAGIDPYTVLIDRVGDDNVRGIRQH